MERVIKYRKINTRFSRAKDDTNKYDGHLTIHFRWGDFYPKGRNPLAHKELGQVVKEIKPILLERGISSSVVNTGFGEWKDLTFLYIKKEDIEEIFNLTCDIFKNKI